LSLSGICNGLENGLFVAAGPTMECIKFLHVILIRLRILISIPAKKILSARTISFKYCGRSSSMFKFLQGLQDRSQLGRRRYVRSYCKYESSLDGNARPAEVCI
jgi:hypothetical protein